MANTPVVDPWLVNADGSIDPFSRNIDFGMSSQDEIEDPESITPTVLQPEIIGHQPPAPVEPAPVPPPASVVEPQEPEGPEVTELEDGGTITLEKEKGQWKATLDPGNGANAEVFWGKNKNGLMTNVLKAKLNATKKIRDLNKQLKLGNQAVKPAPVKPAPVPQTRELTADELFEIQTELQANPDKALETWFQKKTGLSVTQLVDIAKRGAVADAELRIEAISREFLSKNPDYHPDDKNVETIVRWLGKYKIGNPAATMYDLDAAGQWTVENLEEAFADLSDDGLLVKAPKPPKAPRQAESTPQVPVPSEQVPAPRPDERIVRTETRPRAALGIRTSELTPVAPPEAPTAPSDDDLNNMSDAQIAQLLGGVKRMRIQTRRSN